jgi:hypothetical protein
MELQPIENPIVIHPHLLQRFLKHGKDYANLLALYSFYLYHAQRQKTNQPLATDEFTRKGMNWAMERVKKTKKILKEMKIIEVVQKRQYYYVHLFFIYTKKKIGEILGSCEESQETTGKTTETEALAPKKPEVEKPEIKKAKVEKTEIKKESKAKLKPSVPSLPTVLSKWLDYCDKGGVKYGKNNVKYWDKKLDGRVSIEQQEAIYKAMDRGWKDFYLVEKKNSKYHKFLGRSLKMKRDCDTLLDIGYRDKTYIYQFKNIKVTTKEPPIELFGRCGYLKPKVEVVSAVSGIQDRILGLIKRF